MREGVGMSQEPIDIALTKNTLLRVLLLCVAFCLLLNTGASCVSFTETRVTIERCLSSVETLEVYRFKEANAPRGGPCQDTSFAAQSIDQKAFKSLDLTQGKSFDLPQQQSGELLLFRFIKQGETPYCSLCQEGTQADTLKLCTLDGPAWCTPVEPTQEPQVEPTKEASPEPQVPEPSPEPQTEPAPEPAPEPIVEDAAAPEPEPVPEPTPEPTPELPGVGNSCNPDIPCPNGLLCQNNRCALCTTREQCIKALQSDLVTCEQGQCVKTQCFSTGDCPMQEACVNFKCTPCNSTNCGKGYVCVEGACTKGNCTNDTMCAASGQVCLRFNCATCTNGRICNYSTPHACFRNTCIKVGCVRNSDCQTSQTCQDFNCR